MELQMTGSIFKSTDVIITMLMSILPDPMRGCNFALVKFPLFKP